MIKITEKQKEQLAEAGIRMLSYSVVAGIGLKINNMIMEHKVDENYKNAETKKELLRMKKWKIRNDIDQLKK